MDKLLTSIKSFLDLNKLAAISVPGIIVAFTIVFAFWTPLRGEAFMFPAGEATAGSLPEPTDQTCAYVPVPLSYVAWPQRKERDESLRRLQRAREMLVLCRHEHTARLADGSPTETELTQRLKTLESVRDSLMRKYFAFQSSGNPMRNEVLGEAESLRPEIDDLRRRVKRNTDLQRPTQRTVALDSTYIAAIDARLKAFPGTNLSQEFAAAVTEIGQNTLAFIVLAGLAGLLVSPLQQGIFGWWFDGSQAAAWNYRRPGRYWVVRPDKKPPNPDTRFALQQYESAIQANTRVDFNAARQQVLNGQPQTTVDFDAIPVPDMLRMFPEYAIGQHVIDRAEYDDIRSRFYTQAELALGTTCALLLLVATTALLRVENLWRYALYAFLGALVTHVVATALGSLRARRRAYQIAVAAELTAAAGVLVAVRSANFVAIARWCGWAIALCGLTALILFIGARWSFTKQPKWLPRRSKSNWQSVRTACYGSLTVAGILLLSWAIITAPTARAVLVGVAVSIAAFDFFTVVSASARRSPPARLTAAALFAALAVVLLTVPNGTLWFKACVFVAVIAAIVFGGSFIGFDRLHKYYSELQSLIAGRYRALLKEKFDADVAAAKKAAAAQPALEKLDEITKAITDITTTLTDVKERVGQGPGGDVTTIVALNQAL